MSAQALSRAELPIAHPISVLIVDDSAVVRVALSRLVAAHPGLRVAATLDGARRAIDWLSVNVADVVLLDIQMPGIDGLAALPELIAAADGARILIVSSVAAEGAAATIEALALGADETLAKPVAGVLGQDFASDLVERIVRLGQSRAENRGATEPPVALRCCPVEPIACVAIGASTGGIPALQALLSALPARFDAPILVTQHLPTAFIQFFAEQLGAKVGRPVSVAVDASPLRRGAIHVAPGDAHLSLARRGNAVRIVLANAPVTSGCMPSLDPMFGAIADLYGRSGVAVVLTGMGRDGTEGARVIARAGGTIIAQDRASSTVWGMPGSIASAGLASHLGSPAQLADYLAGRGAA